MEKIEPSQDERSQTSSAIGDIKIDIDNYHWRQSEQKAKEVIGQVTANSLLEERGYLFVEFSHTSNQLLIDETYPNTITENAVGKVMKLVLEQAAELWSIADRLETDLKAKPFINIDFIRTFTDNNIEYVIANVDLCIILWPSDISAFTHRITLSMKAGLKGLMSGEATDSPAEVFTTKNINKIIIRRNLLDLI